MEKQRKLWHGKEHLKVKSKIYMQGSLEMEVMRLHEQEASEVSGEIKEKISFQH
jgi:hypothetical protein